MGQLSVYRVVCNVLFLGMIAVLLVRVALSAATTLVFPNEGDSAYLYYLAWLGSEGFVPYRDIYDTTFPGSFLLYQLITAIVGYSDTGLRLTDLGVLLLLCALTWCLLARFSRAGALVCALAFADFFLLNPTLALQRDYLGLVMIVAALVLVINTSPHADWRTWLAALLFGVATTIKPHLLIGAPVLFLYGLRQSRCARLLVIWTSSIALVWLVCIGYLWQRGGLSHFVEMLRDFMPLYLQMDGELQETVWQLPDVMDLLDRLLEFSDLYVLVMSLTMLFACLLNSSLARHWRLVVALFALTLAYRIYVMIGMKGWDYHRLPAQYFFICGFIVVLTRYAGYSFWVKSLHVVLMAFVLLTFVVNDPYQVYFGDHFAKRLAEARRALLQPAGEVPGAGQLVEYLSRHTVHGCVEPRLQSTYGPVFPAMLQLRLKPCTRFQLSQMFYHHVNDAYIQSKRLEYLASLADSRPAFILDDGQFAHYNRFSNNSPPLSADGVERSTFEGYEQFLEANYQLVFDNQLRQPNRVLVYQRRPDGGG